MEIRPTTAVKSSPQRRPAKAAGDEPLDTVVQGGSFSGDVRQMKIGGRDVWVYLPPAYKHEPDRHFPVLYVHDGQNVFNRETAFGGTEWGLDEAAEEQIRRGTMQDVIIVAVANAGGGRLDEYTPVPDEDGRGGHAEEYGRFLVDGVKPVIDKKFRTLTTPETTGVMGSSLGGLVSLWLGYNHPGAFGLVGALSPSLWWAGRDMIAEVASHSGPQPGQVWLTVGDQESSTDENHNGVADFVEDARDLGNLMLSQGFEQGKTLHYHEFAGAGHNEWSWSQQVGKMLSTLYPAHQR